MPRRTFLRSAVSAIPAATLTQPFALASDTPPLKTAHLVPAGKDVEAQTRSLGFSHIAFKTLSAETSGNLFLVEHSNLLPGGPPVHYHLSQDEWFYIMEGHVLFQVGEKRLALGPGDSVLAPRMVPHGFTALGPDPAKMLIAFTPAGKMEQFFRDQAHGPVNLMDAALFSRYDMKLVGPPIKA